MENIVRMGDGRVCDDVIGVRIVTVNMLSLGVPSLLSFPLFHSLTYPPTHPHTDHPSTHPMHLARVHGVHALSPRGSEHVAGSMICFMIVAWIAHLCAIPCGVAQGKFWETLLCTILRTMGEEMRKRSLVRALALLKMKKPLLQEGLEVFSAGHEEALVELAHCYQKKRLGWKEIFETMRKMDVVDKEVCLALCKKATDAIIWCYKRVKAARTGERLPGPVRNIGEAKRGRHHAGDPGAKLLLALKDEGDTQENASSAAAPKVDPDTMSAKKKLRAIYSLESSPRAHVTTPQCLKQGEAFAEELASSSTEEEESPKEHAGGEPASSSGEPPATSSSGLELVPSSRSPPHLLQWTDRQSAVVKRLLPSGEVWSADMQAGPSGHLEAKFGEELIHTDIPNEVLDSTKTKAKVLKRPAHAAVKAKPAKPMEASPHDGVVYYMEYYSKMKSLGIRTKVGKKRTQLFSIGSPTHTKQQLEALGSKCIEKLQAAEEAAGVKAWAMAKLGGQ